MNATDVCVTQEDADAIYRLGNWEYAYRWRGVENATHYSALKMGVFFHELQANLHAAASGKSPVKYQHK